jgi:DNA adenine methylase
LLSDINSELIATFEQVARHPRPIISRLSRMSATRGEYQRVRRWEPESPLELAVRFIYLNRNCYGGLYRENRDGRFNVPYGGGERNHKRLCDNGAVLEASRLLNRPGVELRLCDFEEALSLARAGDVVYCDPTYREVTRKQFDRYGKTVFQWKDQQRLARLAGAAFQRGVTIILSNATCDGIRELYRRAGVVELKRRKGLGPNGNHHGQREYLFIMDPSGLDGVGDRARVPGQADQFVAARSGRRLKTGVFGRAKSFRPQGDGEGEGRGSTGDRVM